MGGVVVNLIKIHCVHYETIKELINIFFKKRDHVCEVLYLPRDTVLTSVAAVADLLTQCSCVTVTIVTTS